MSLLRHRDRATVPLEDELRYARSFLEISQLRFADRLSVRIEPDPDVLDAAVPHMALQPVVENAVRHGIGCRVGGGSIEALSTATATSKLSFRAAAFSRRLGRTNGGPRIPQRRTGVRPQ